MTAADLIAELQRLPPDKPVCVVLASVLIQDEHEFIEAHLHEGDAQAADRVRDRGSYILIDCG